MNLETAQLLRDIIKTRSISKASGLNGVSVSAASQALMELERSLNVMLIDRSTRPVAPTTAGKLADAAARDMLLRWQEFISELEALNAQKTRVRVGAIYSIGLTLMSSVDAVLKTKLPDIVMDVEYLRPERIYEGVAEGRLDLGLVSFPSSTHTLAVVPWIEEQLSLIMPKDHTLASKSLIIPADIDSVDFVAFDDEIPFAKAIDKYLRASRSTPNKVMTFDNIQVIREAVVLGRGVSILPTRAVTSEVEAGRLLARPLKGLTRPLGILHRKKPPLSEGMLKLIEILQIEGKRALSTSEKSPAVRTVTKSHPHEQEA
jgi:DNA-binding transcriptional LysR family regulator